MHNFVIKLKKGDYVKKIFLLLTLVLLSVESSHAIGVNTSRYFDKGLIYSGSSFPVDSVKNTENELKPIDDLKCGESSANNILGLVETGDASINAAARNGGISKIYYVDTKISKVYVPLGFIPVYVKQIKTVVYGE